MSSTGNEDHSHHQMERARTARGTKARPLWREATALSIEDRLRHTRGLPTTSQDSCHRARTPATPTIDTSAVGYIGQPEDVASAVAYLASKEAHFITGKSPISQGLCAN
ncbi:hypothetical protein EV424DRAFT_1542858 [Suillus variegatus]|nr:hypothetical protein EV424DRAFT_1542858 [Suillus variegatus]